MNPPFVPQVEVPVWSYTAPRSPDGYPEQKYYGTSYELGFFCQNFSLQAVHAYIPDDVTEVDAMVYAIGSAPDVRLELSSGMFMARARMDLESVTRLINALSDARYDLLQELERQRLSDSLREIREELDERGEDGPGCYYGHPWVFYVAPGQAAAKCEELNAQGLAEYIVLEDAEMASAIAPTATEEAPAP